MGAVALRLKAAERCPMRPRVRRLDGNGVAGIAGTAAAAAGGRMVRTALLPTAAA